MSLFLKHRLPGTWGRRTLYGLSLYILTSYIAELVFSEARLCTRHGLSCDDDAIAYLLNLCLVFISFATTTVLGCVRLYRTALHPGWVSKQPSHWTTAASRHVYLECSSMIRDAQNASFALIGSITALGGTARFLNALDDPYLGKPEVEKSVLAVCGSTSNVCHLSLTTYSAMFMATSGMMLYIICTYILTPISCWSPVFQEAARHEQEWRHTRLPLSSWVTAVLGFTAFGLAAYLTLFVAPFSVSASGAVAYFWATVALLVAEIATVAWLNELYKLHLAPKLMKQYAKTCISTVLWIVDRWVKRNRVGTPLSGLWARHHSAYMTFEPSLRFRTLVVLLLNIFLWTFSASTASEFYNYTMWACRFFGLTYFVFGRDAPANFHDLIDDPGFGLVADKRDVCKGLNAVLQGKKYKGTVRRYKASTMRMQETVST